jgi:hypothetical protein
MQITIFTYFLDNVIKTNRALNSTLKGTILLAQDGYGAEKIARLALIVSKYGVKDFSNVLNNFTPAKWSSELKGIMT